MSTLSLWHIWIVRAIKPLY